MSQIEEVGKTFYLIEKGHLCGIFKIEEKGDLFVPWYQLNPFGKKEIIELLIGNHARTVFNAVCDYFGKMNMAVQTIPDVITDDEYLASMWILFKKKFLPKEFVNQLQEKVKAKESYATGFRLLKLEIEMLNKMPPYYKDVSYMSVWEKWLKKWEIKK